MKTFLKLFSWMTVIHCLAAVLHAQEGPPGLPPPPSINLTITAPTSGSQFGTGTPIPIQATAIDLQGAVYRVDPNRPRAEGTIQDNEPVFSFELPENGDWFPEGAPVEIRVQATWTAGVVSQLEFLADGQKIGDSVVNFLVEPAPGTPVLHEFVWLNARAGEHRLTVRAPLADGTVVELAEGPTIRVGTVEEAPEVSLEVLDGEFSEGGPGTTDRAEVQVRRTGSVEQPLTVFLQWDGSATPTVDYGPVAQEVTFKPGEKAVVLALSGVPDDLPEGDETVVVSIIIPPSLPGSLLYRIGGTGQVRLILHDGTGGEGDIPVVTVQTGNSYALEGDRFNRGEFILQRSGDPAQELAVNFELSGGAIRGVDYRLILNPCDDCAAPDQELTGDTVIFPAGQSTVTLGVVASFDGLLAVAEPILEDVHLQVYTPPIPAMVGAKPPYVAGNPDRGTMQVVDRRNSDGAEVILIAPAAGAFLPLGVPNTLQAIAVDPVGSIRRVEFLANGQAIGVSEIMTKEMDVPGRLRVHFLSWTVNDATLAGPFELTARARTSAGSEIESNVVPVTLGGTDPSLPVVTLAVGKSPAQEVGELSNRLGGFLLTRRGGGDFAKSLTVFVEFGGTATLGLDYHWIAPVDGTGGAPEPGSLPFFGPFLPVTFAPGTTEVSFYFTASTDELPEGDETVRLRLVESPILALGLPDLANFPAYYTIGEPNEAEVLIQDADLDQPRIRLTQPTDGRQFQLGEVIPFEATAVNPEAGVETIQFLVDGQVVATVDYCCDVCDCAPAPKGRPFTARFAWPAPAPGAHVVSARTFFGPGQVLESSPVTIVVSDSFLGSLTIISPPEGASFPVGQTITIDTLGLDSTSLVSTVEFFANGEKIGETCFICVVDGIFPPGSPIHNQIQWTPAKPGRYELTAIGQFGANQRITSPPVTVQIQGQVGGPRLTILEPQDGASVPAGANLPVVAIGVGREGGITDVALLVDGKPAGESHVVFIWPPGADEEVRHEFTIQLEAGTHQLVVQDLADPALASAPVTVVAGPVEAAITWVTPGEGAEFPTGKEILLEVQAVDPTGLFFQVEFFDGDRLIGTSEFSCLTCRLAPGAVIPHRFEWREAAVGEHSLTARATRADGTVVSSSPRRIVVTSDPVSGSFVTRFLPAGYAVGQPFTVRLEARPDTSVAAYVVEDLPPYSLPAPGLPDGPPAPGWQVTSISNGGVLDPQTGKVKFGPFFDNQARTLTYEIIPNFVAELAQFTGVGVADGRSSSIAGDSSLRGQSRHPADHQPSDDSIGAAELTGYAAAWKREQTWPDGPNPIPVAYVTRAAALWQGGERYVYNPDSGVPPFCWVNGLRATPSDRQASPPLPLAGIAVRQTEAQADGSIRITVRVTSAPGTRAFAVEEYLPESGTVSDITGDGRFTPGSRILRWGPFLANENPVLSYVRRGATAENEPKGIVSFDGQDLVIRRHAAPTEEAPDRLMGVDTLHDGSHQVALEAEALQHGAEYELQVGSDLKHWTPVGTFSSGHDTGFARDTTTTANAEVRFYRAVRVK